MQQEAKQRKTVGVEEAAEWLGIGRSSAYAAVRTGDIPTIPDWTFDPGPGCDARTDARREGRGMSGAFSLLPPDCTIPPSGRAAITSIMAEVETLSRSTSRICVASGTAKGGLEGLTDRELERVETALGRAVDGLWRRRTHFADCRIFACARCSRKQRVVPAGAFPAGWSEGNFSPYLPRLHGRRRPRSRAQARRRNRTEGRARKGLE